MIVDDLLTPVPMGSFTSSRLGLGTARVGAFWQGKRIDEGVHAVRCAVDQGVTLVDTADVYARGISERIVRRAVGARQGVVVITKVGLLKTPAGLVRAGVSSGGLPSAAGLKRAATAATCFEPQYVRAAAAASRRRLGRNQLDVLLLHEATAQDLREARFLPAIEAMIAEGSITDWGVSVRDEAAARQALALPGLRWLQLPANIERRQIAAAIAADSRRLQVTVLALGVLGDGTLLQGDGDMPHPQEQVPYLVRGALALPGIDGALLGMSTPEHVVNNLAALKRYDLRHSAITGGAE